MDIYFYKNNIVLVIFLFSTTYASLCMGKTVTQENKQKTPSFSYIITFTNPLKNTTKEI